MASSALKPAEEISGADPAHTRKAGDLEEIPDQPGDILT